MKMCMLMHENCIGGSWYWIIKKQTNSRWRVARNILIKNPELK